MNNYCFRVCCNEPASPQTGISTVCYCGEKRWADEGTAVSAGSKSWQIERERNRTFPEVCVPWRYRVCAPMPDSVARPCGFQIFTSAFSARCCCILMTVFLSGIFHPGVLQPRRMTYTTPVSAHDCLLIVAGTVPNETSSIADAAHSLSNLIDVMTV